MKQPSKGALAAELRSRGRGRVGAARVEKMAEKILERPRPRPGPLRNLIDTASKHG